MQMEEQIVSRAQLHEKSVKKAKEIQDYFFNRNQGIETEQDYRARVINTGQPLDYETPLEIKEFDFGSQEELTDEEYNKMYVDYFGISANQGDDTSTVIIAANGDHYEKINDRFDGIIDNYSISDARRRMYYPGGRPRNSHPLHDFSKGVEVLTDQDILKMNSSYGIYGRNYDASALGEPRVLRSDIDAD